MDNRALPTAVDRHPLTPEGWILHHYRTGEHLHVIVNGEDVTGRCATADERAGVATCYRLNTQGHKFLELSGFVAMETLRGDVAIVPGEPLR
jgi:hypothetical protein